MRKIILLLVLFVSVIGYAQTTTYAYDVYDNRTPNGWNSVYQNGFISRTKDTVSIKYTYKWTDTIVIDSKEKIYDDILYHCHNIKTDSIVTLRVNMYTLYYYEDKIYRRFFLTEKFK